jgi:membrane protease YdiL (CAAX protease family)
VIVAGWLAISLALGFRRGWFERPRPVMWPIEPAGNLLLVLTAMLLAGPVAMALAARVPVTSDATMSPLVTVLASGGTAVTAWLVACRFFPAPAPSPPSAPLGRAIIAGLVGLAVAWPFVTLTAWSGDMLQQAMGGPAVPAVAHDTLELLRANASRPSAWLLALSVVTLTPLAEELVWRGGMQQLLKGVGMPRMAAMAVTAACFALVHWNAVPTSARLSALPALAALGFALGWLMERTGRLAAAVTAHAAFNMANLLLFSMLPE